MLKMPADSSRNGMFTCFILLQVHLRRDYKEPLVGWLGRCLFTLGVFRFSLDRLSLRIVACIDVSTYPERQTRLSHSVLLFCSLVLKAFFYSSRAVVLNSMLMNF